MPIFLKSGKSFEVSARENFDIHERLPVGTYSVKRNCKGEFYLETIEAFEVKGKLYGDTNRNADRILRTFLDREVSTGVLLSGEKGSGKTMLAKRISIMAASEKDIPTLVINQSWHGETFNQFIQMIDQPTIMIFDEFEKVYGDEKAQESLLTLLDGVYPSKKLFIFTANNKWSLNDNMKNRPGRIFYALDYDGLNHEFIQEYCEDNLVNKEYISMVCAISQVFRRFNFDMLKALVEEMNRYDETPAEALKFLNAQVDFDVYMSYRVRLVVNGASIEGLHSDTWRGIPLKELVRIYYDEEGDGNEDSDEETKTIQFSPKDFEQVDSRTGTYTFVKKKNGHTLTLRPLRKPLSVDFSVVQKKRKVDTTSSVTDSDSDSESLYDE